ncbi:chaperone protein dnaJ C76, chloroplastic-like [Henckelia pumila]|uniref:chaperone protein dnaJ C76, chloroplastic-like n=1 Tax=Henckelia pumila TaxID=405737 RepID=UPI003C6E87AD
MQAAAALLSLHAPSLTITKSTALASNYPPSAKRSSHQKASRNNVSACRASGSSQSGSAITDFNLYELLGVEDFSDRSQIKEAYRALQKRCHPDIAGPAGHDMAIVLNEAYALLSDPLSRVAYDKELSKVADLRGYTGKPIYSVWLGSESEQRAVFVDEVKCVGCLKCALFATKTFAVESVYGRARVVAQWADHEDKIQEAIGACPVDCISFVERSDLPALEFIMSKQPRGRVRIGVGNTVGVRASDVFNEVEKFQARYAHHKAYSKGSESPNASRASAIQAIQMISNWLYWQSPLTDAMPPATQDSSTATSKRARPSSIKMLKAAVAARKEAGATATRPDQGSSSEYWVPSTRGLPDATTPDCGSKPAFNPSPTQKTSRPRTNESLNPKGEFSYTLRLGVPIATAIVAATVAASQIGEPVGGLKDHIGGPLALAIVNSSWFQVSLAGVTWYIIAMYLVELVEAIRRK